MKAPDSGRAALEPDDVACGNHPEARCGKLQAQEDVAQLKSPP